MRIVRGAILTFALALGLVAGVAATAYADDGWTDGSITVLVPTAPVAADATSADASPGDPGIPPE